MAAQATDHSLDCDYSRLNHYWAKPNDSLHMVLKAISQGHLDESTVCQQTHRSQGYYGADIFVVPRRYGLVGIDGDKAWGNPDFSFVGRYLVGGLTQRGRQVLKQLDQGKVISLKTLKVDAKRTQQAQGKTALDYAKIDPHSSSACTLRWLRDNSGKHRYQDVVQGGGMHVNDATRYLRKLEKLGLVVLFRDRGNRIKQIEATQLGIEFANQLESQMDESMRKYEVGQYNKFRNVLLHNKFFHEDYSSPSYNRMTIKQLYHNYLSLDLGRLSDYFEAYRNVMSHSPQAVTAKKAKDHQTIIAYYKSILPSIKTLYKYFEFINDQPYNEIYPKYRFLFGEFYTEKDGVEFMLKYFPEKQMPK